LLKAGNLCYPGKMLLLHTTHCFFLSIFVRILNAPQLKYILVLFVVLSFGSATLSAYGQVERGGVPRSFQFHESLKSQSLPVEIAAPDMLSIQKEDYDDAMYEKSYRVGVEVPVSIPILNSGQWEDLPAGGRIWRVTIICKGAQAIGLNYNELRLPPGADVFVYTQDQKFVIGALTSAEVPQNQKFATRPLSGDAIVLEYFEPDWVKEQAIIDISGIVYIYRGFEAQDFEKSKSVSSGICEVNVNCSEGENWQKQKQGVVKILTKVGSRYYSCTGSLLNNTAQDFKGLLLTASHCSKDGSGGVSSFSDYEQWIFYFNYEYSGCVPSATSQSTIVGVKKLAIGATSSDIGSDFLLMQSLKNVPAQYNAYYCGWDAGNGNSASGACIHHPDGDVKKISTYNTLLKSGTNLESSTPNTAWLVTWTQTVNGYGVTEGGSSGSPLFDDEGLIIGTLTGGDSGCANETGVDMFGKVSYSWESNGTTADMQLKPWLDPGNILEAEGIFKMPGSFNDNLAVADFSANTVVIPIGGTINFQDLSAGKPTKWHWYFQGGNPTESTVQNPSGVLFDRFGKMNVKLVVSNIYNSDSIVKEGFIDVRAILSPNPCTGVINILPDNNNSNSIGIDVFDLQGKRYPNYPYSGSASGGYTIILPGSGNFFFVKLIQGSTVQIHKVIVVRR
jgi:PKD repeat protein